MAKILLLTPLALTFCELLSLALSGYTDASRPDVVIEHKDTEIGFFHERKTHEEAETACGEWGGGLVNIQTLNIQRTIHRHLRKMRPYDISSKWRREGTYAVGFHVGATLRNGRWKWSDSSSVPLRGSRSWHRWGPKRPTSERSHKKCMSILILRTSRMTEGHHLGTWVENACEEAKYYICQREQGRICDERQRILPYRHTGCERRKGFDNFDIHEWMQDSGAQWKIRNTGKDVEIKIHPEGGLKTVVGSSRTKLVVEKILLKWGAHHRTGSEHSLGSFKFAGELQIFHKNHHQLGRHAISFFLRERHNPGNAAWTSLLGKIRDVVNIDSETEDDSPPSLQNLTSGDLHGPHRTAHSYRTGKFIRYRGTSTATPCIPYTWTVYERPLFLSTSQMNYFRSLHKLPSKDTSRLNLKPNPEISTCRVVKAAYLI